MAIHRLFFDYLLISVKWGKTDPGGMNAPSPDPRPQTLSDGNAMKKHENFRAMSDDRNDRLTYGRVFSSLP